MTVHVAPGLSRRRFLVATSALGVAAGLAPYPLADFAYALAPTPDWQSLADRLAGPVLRPDDSRYGRFATPFNLAFDTAERQPTAIALCANRRDVATAVTWARDRGISPVVRAGGHSYAGYSMGPGLMIDVSIMKRFSWNGPRTALTVECGASNGDVYNVLRAEGRTMTHGRCPTVGVAGFMLGGGIGFNMRLHGVASDGLLASDIVTADGAVLALSEQENEDLFWACRGGGGGNFGINTAFTLETVAVDGVTVFLIQWKAGRKDAEDIALKLMTALDNGDNRLGSRFKFYRDPSPPPGGDTAFVEVLGQWHGAEREVRALLESVLALPQRTTAIIREMRYWDGQDFLLDWDGPFRFLERSLFLKQNLDAAAIHTAFDALWKLRPSADKTLYADVRFFQTGGRMNDVDPAATAFVHRDSRWLLDIGLPWSADDLRDPSWLADNRKVQDDLFAAMAATKASTGGSYQNFADPALQDFAKAYYGRNLERLRKVKRDYDPKNMFKFEQSIPPAA
jgi:FAD/FMN-containing dehydrogenase